MIIFFRKIRHDFILSGKAIKYLKYAIGEIILLVFGILIALQVNNWNENRKERGHEQEYLYRLLTDIEKDHKTLIFSKELTQERIHQIDALSDALVHSDSLHYP